MQALRIDVAAIHDIDRRRFEDQFVQNVEVVDRAIGDLHEGQNTSAQVQERVELDRSLCAPEMRPRKQRQAEIDRRGRPVCRWFSFEIDTEV